MNNERNVMQELVSTLNKARKAYEQGHHEIMSNAEYDALYVKLLEMEKSTGIVFANSPTQNVGYEVVSDLPKSTHPVPMLSLDKTKDVVALESFLDTKRGILSYKLDGLTVVLTYEDGILISAVTRGDGAVGEVVTSNAKAFKNVPLTIPYKGKLVVRGEAIISYADFEEINSKIVDATSKYKNPRNLASGSVRQLDSSITAERHVQFIAIQLGYDREFINETGLNSMQHQFEFLVEQGFAVVGHCRVTADNVGFILDAMSTQEALTILGVPVDGLVLCYDDVVYGHSLGATSKFPHNAIAFKWADETAKTVLRQIEWSASRTGLLNPVAIFDPVELEGTSVSRASLHNLDIIVGLNLKIGDEISVYKANMIIPQVLENLSANKREHHEEILVFEKDVVPLVCPVCTNYVDYRGGKSTGQAWVVVCPNEKCPAKKVGAFVRMCDRDALNIEGISEATLELFCHQGFLKELPDIFRLNQYKDQIVALEGFGEKSYSKMIKSIEKAKETTLNRIIYSLGLTHIGRSVSKSIAKLCNQCPGLLMSVDEDDLRSVEGIGTAIVESWRTFINNVEHVDIFWDIVDACRLPEVSDESSIQQDLRGFTFVITGSLNHFENRDALKADIESKGGKVSGSVSKNTDFLINNDLNSPSGKNQKARTLGVKIISEETYLTSILGLL